MIRLKSKKDIAGIRDAGIILAETFAEIKKYIAAGMTTKEVDDIAREYVLARKAKPACLGYYGYPASACISVNDTLIHGIPSNKIFRSITIICFVIIWH